MDAVFPSSEHVSFPSSHLLSHGTICRHAVKAEVGRVFGILMDNRGHRSPEILYLRAGRYVVTEARRQRDQFQALPAEVQQAILITDSEISNSFLPPAERDGRISQIIGKNPLRDAEMVFRLRDEPLTARKKAWAAYNVAVYFCRGMREALS